MTLKSLRHGRLEGSPAGGLTRKECFWAAPGNQKARAGHDFAHDSYELEERSITVIARLSLLLLQTPLRDGGPNETCHVVVPLRGILAHVLFYDRLNLTVGHPPYAFDHA